MHLHTDYIHRARLFISYANEDTALRKTLVSELRRMGFSVWCDEMIPPGTQYRRTIEEKIAASSVLVVIWSDNAENSSWGGSGLCPAWSP